MNQIVTLLLVMASFAPFGSAPQSGRGAAAASTPAFHACSILTKELLTQHTPLSKRAFDLSFNPSAHEDAVGKSGSECTNGGVTLTIDGFTAEYFEKTRTKEWKAVSGIGDTAYFRDNGGRFAELYIRTGSHVFTIQMDVPMDRTSESIQPNAIAMAKEILPKLK